MKPGSKLTLQIDRLSLGGDGVGRAEGFVVFVPFTAPGDRVEVEMTETHARHAKARWTRIVSPAPMRVDAPCPYFLRCGGCSWQHLAYDAQLRSKTELVRETLERIGGLHGVSVKPTLGMSHPWRYRNKVQQPVGFAGGGVRPNADKGSDPAARLISGFYATGSHDIIPIEDCLIQSELSVRIVNRAKALLQQIGARAYDARHGSGWIRHLLVRTTDDRALLTFVTHSPEFPHQERIVSSLIREFPELAGIHQNIQPAKSNVILGRQWRRLAGADHLEERLGRLRFRLSPASFFQVNRLQAEVLYNIVREMAGQGERLLDAYAGVGTIALWLAERFREVGGIEEIRPAVEDARANARLNRIDNVHFETAPVEYFLRGMPRSAGGRGLTVVLDPPRAGCARPALEALLKLSPGRIVYVSCDPGTLARDLAILVQGGYEIGAVQPVDLFPHTPHIETAVELQRIRRG